MNIASSIPGIVSIAVFRRLTWHRNLPSHVPALTSGKSQKNVYLTAIPTKFESESRALGYSADSLVLSDGIGNAANKARSIVH